MGKLVEATRMGYYGNARRRPGEQFVMEDAVFQKKVFDDKGKEVKGKNGKAEMEDSVPTWVEVVEDGYEDPLVPKESSMKPVKKVVAKALKKQADDHRQGGAFDVHPETGVQVTGQVAPAKPASSSFHSEGRKSSGDKDVI